MGDSKPHTPQIFRRIGCRRPGHQKAFCVTGAVTRRNEVVHLFHKDIAFGTDQQGGERVVTRFARSDGEAVRAI